jgi:hypothetical protein
MCGFAGPTPADVAAASMKAAASANPAPPPPYRPRRRSRLTPRDDGSKEGDAEDDADPEPPEPETPLSPQDAARKMPRVVMYRRQELERPCDQPKGDDSWDARFTIQVCVRRALPVACYVTACGVRR